MSKHSEGPWRASKIDPEDTFFEDVNILRPDGLAVAVAVANGDIDPGTAAANANLMAASPDLLAALKDAVGALEFSRDFHSDLSNEEQSFAQDKLDAALAAIAKAEGRS